jgi:hypothetical protein
MKGNDSVDAESLAQLLLEEDRDYREWWMRQWKKNPLNILDRPTIPGCPITLDVFTPEGGVAVTIEFDSWGFDDQTS